ncbi:creatininase family protein [Aureimonas fodinaquatilis]|nr:creatininase family protein [Aureimonas fodinaquatilis]
MTTTDISGCGCLRHAVAVLPFAAIEQHGPHLPLGTDAIIADNMVQRAAASLPKDLPVTFLSPLRIGVSTEHARFAGTLNLGWKAGTEMLVQIIGDLVRAGFARVVIVSSHGGNSAAIDTAALEARNTHDCLVVASSWQRFGLPDNLLPQGEVAFGIHGGAVETALMLAFRPDLVRRDHRQVFPSFQQELEATHQRLRAHGRLGFGWMAQDLNAQGVVGDTRLANAAMGEAIAAHQVQGFCELLRDVLAFDLERLRQTRL